MAIDSGKLFEEIFPRLRTLERRQSYIAGVGAGISITLGVLLVVLGFLGSMQVERIDRLEAQVTKFDQAWEQVRADLSAIRQAVEKP